MKSLTPKERDHIRQTIVLASERITPFSSIRAMLRHNQIHGLQNLPFDQHARKGKHLLTNHKHVTNEEYRQMYREGRIKPESLTRAFQRVGPRQDQQDVLQLEGRLITAPEVWWLHLIVGFKPLEPARLDWKLSDHGSTKQFHQHLPKESRQRIIARTIEECELCREYPEKAYLTNLWKTTLTALQSNGCHITSQPIDRLVSPTTETVSLPEQQTMSGWVESLARVSLVSQINDLVMKRVTTFLDQEVAGREIPQRSDSFYDTWRQLAQEDVSNTVYGIKGLNQRINDLPTDPEDTIASNLEHLGIPQKQWQSYLAQQLSLSAGWIRFIRWLEEHPDYEDQSKHFIDPIQYLAVRLCYEVELSQMICQQKWGIDGTVSSLTAYWNDRPREYEALISEGSDSIDKHTQRTCRDAWRFFHLAQFLELSPIDVLDLSLVDAQTLLRWLDDFPLDQHSLVWLEAYEESYRGDMY